MARDLMSWAVRTTFQTTGPKSGKTSNTFYFARLGGVPPGTTDQTNLINDVWAFWHGTAGGAGTVEYFLGPQIYRGTNSVEMDLYALDLADIHHAFGSPVMTVFKSPQAAGSSVPQANEVCGVLSYRAVYGSDPEHDGSTRPRAQDRGRAYIGPLGSNATQNFTAPNGTIALQLNTSFVSGVSSAFSALSTAAAGHEFSLSVWSRKDALLKAAAYKAMDTSIDIQRRREMEPPGLQTWVLV